MSVHSQATDGQLTDGLFITRRHLMQGETGGEVTEIKKGKYIKRGWCILPTRDGEKMKKGQGDRITSTGRNRQRKTPCL